MPDREALLEQLKTLCRTESMTLWEQGDVLVEAALSDEDLGKWAQTVQRKASTLRERERVSREFPKSMRDSRHAWTVYKALLRIPKADARLELLNARGEWTVEGMEGQVREWLVKEAKAAGLTYGNGPRSPNRAGMKLGNLRVLGTLNDDGLVKITIEGRPLDEVKINDVGDAVVVNFRV